MSGWRSPLDTRRLPPGMERQGGLARLKLAPLQALRRLEDEIHVYRVEWELNFSVRVPSQHACREQGMDVTVNCLYVPLGAPRRFAQSHRPTAGHRLEQFPTLGSEHLPEQVCRRKGDMCTATLAGEGV